MTENVNEASITPCNDTILCFLYVLLPSCTHAERTRKEDHLLVQSIHACNQNMAPTKIRQQPQHSFTHRLISPRLSKCLLPGVSCLSGDVSPLLCVTESLFLENSQIQHFLLRIPCSRLRGNCSYSRRAHTSQ